MTKCVCIEGVISANEIGALSATNADEKIEKDMITGQPGTRWPCSKRCRVHRKEQKMNTYCALCCELVFMDVQGTTLCESEDSSNHSFQRGETEVW